MKIVKCTPSMRAQSPVPHLQGVRIVLKMTAGKRNKRRLISDESYQRWFEGKS